MSITHRLASIVTQNVFSHLLSLSPNYEIANAPNDPKMTLNVTRSNVHHIYVTTIARESQILLRFVLWSLVFQIIELLGFSMRYNGDFEIFEHCWKSETQDFKNPNLVLWRKIGEKIRTSLAAIRSRSVLKCSLPLGPMLTETRHSQRKTGKTFFFKKIKEHPGVWPRESHN